MAVSININAVAKAIRENAADRYAKPILEACEAKMAELGVSHNRRAAIGSVPKNTSANGNVRSVLAFVNSVALGDSDSIATLQAIHATAKASIAS